MLMSIKEVVAGSANTTTPNRKSRAAARQAVVLVHGMGEQIPMDTIKGFVSTLSTTIESDGKVEPGEIWSKPDPRTGSLELRRLTTRKSKKGGAFETGVRSDFYELYWADLTAGSTSSQLLGWIWYLLLRPWSRVPKPVRLAWLFLWFCSLLALTLFAIGFIPKEYWELAVPKWFPQSLAIGLAGILGVVAQQLGTKSFGRVVRYTRAEPDNIAARAAVRERGLQLLRALHDRDDYDRVVVVGHSLGSILAYDLVSYFWAEREAIRSVAVGTDAFASLCEVHSAARFSEMADVDGKEQRTRLRRAQAEFRRRLSTGEATSGEKWLISDLVTFGSPLTHAEFLLARDTADLFKRQADRELPTCPPIMEPLEDWAVRPAVEAGLLPPGATTGSAMAFPSRMKKGSWTLHHGAVFAAVRWTNVHDRARLIFFGDLISGPLSRVFGGGIHDINLATVDRQSWRFSHTRYWEMAQDAKRRAVFSAAVNILDEDG